MSSPRNHHYVPQAYLLGFADKREQVCVRWRMAEKPSFITRVRNIASERDFYSFVNDTTGEIDHQSFEAGLNMSETMLREALHEYVAGGATPIETLRLRIALGVGFQMTRTKYFRRKLERMANSAARTWLTAQRPELTEALGSVHFVPGNDVHLKRIRDWAVELAGALLHRSWFLARATAGQFITTDNPVYGIAGHTDALDVGVLAASEIRYPIHSATALVWTPQPGHDAAILFTEGEVREFNAATFANAYEQAYANPGYQAALEQLPRHRDTLIARINAMTQAPDFKKAGTRRFDPPAAAGETSNRHPPMSSAP